MIAPPGQLARLWPRVRPYRGALTLALVTLLLSGGISLAFPQLAGYLVDAAFVRHSRSYLDQVALGLVVLFTIQAALNYVQTYLLPATGERAVAGLRRELFGKLLEMAWVQPHRIGPGRHGPLQRLSYPPDGVRGQSGFLRAIEPIDGL